MKKEFLDVYERPEAEEMTLVFESTILSNTETPDDDGKEDCLFFDPDCESD